MIYLQVTLTTVLSAVTLLLITRLLGYRQLSELSLFDYVNGITIGSIAAELATAEKDEIGPILMAIIIYGLFTLFIAFLTDKSIVLRRIITGKPILLVDKGNVLYKNFKKARLDMSEFLMKCRNNGYFDLSQIYTAVLEPNGRVSFIPTSLNKPVTAEDIKAAPQQENILADVVLDGKIVESNITAVGKDKKWLISALHKMGVENIDELFLVTCDDKYNLTCYKKIMTQAPDILE